ncbi:MAG: hypothetical protein GY814_13220 [Gammaproteobacteria bacterium]|nr:hypothetical protein [Gammaproteobacteria bacterium]
MKQPKMTTPPPPLTLIFIRSKFIAIVTIATTTFFTPLISNAGGVCVVAKELGNSLAIEWVAAERTTITEATKMAYNLLHNKGFIKKKMRDLHVQASTALQHGHVIIIKSRYETRIGKIRTSYGCGFSQHSSAEAKRIAVKNLRSFSWGWKPGFGYELHARHSF